MTGMESSALDAPIIITRNDARAAAQRVAAAARKRAQRDKARPEIVQCPTTGITWHLKRDVKAKEAVRVESGRDVLVPVDVRTYCYQMMCACGRVRYAKPNTLYEVAECRVCAHETRLARRAIKERGKGIALP